MSGDGADAVRKVRARERRGREGDTSGLVEVKCHEVGMSRQATAPERGSSLFP